MERLLRVTKAEKEINLLERWALPQVSGKVGELDNCYRSTEA